MTQREFVNEFADMAYFLEKAQLCVYRKGKRSKITYAALKDLQRLQIMLNATIKFIESESNISS